MTIKDLHPEPSSGKGQVDEIRADAGDPTVPLDVRRRLDRIRGALVSAQLVADAIGAKRLQAQASDGLAALKEGLAA